MSIANADAYQRQFQVEGLERLRGIAGFHSAQLWRRLHGARVEFVAVATFDSKVSVSGLVDSEFERAVAAPRLDLGKIDGRSVYYDVALTSRCFPAKPANS